MGTEALRLCYLLVQLALLGAVPADSDVDSSDVHRQRITLSSLFTHSRYPSVQFALDQVNTHILSRIDRELYLNETEGVVKCDVGTGIKTFFDMLNQSLPLNVLFTDTCQNVLSYISETATHFNLPIISFTDNDLSLLAKDRYPHFYHIVPSDHSHNLVRKQLLQQFNWRRFGLIYQHGSKYTLVANDFSNLTVMDKHPFQVNLTRGLAYRHGTEWHGDNARSIRALLTDFKVVVSVMQQHDVCRAAQDRDVRIIIANFNQTVAVNVFCHAAREQVYGARYQWIILGYPSLSAWWHAPTGCSQQELVRAINGTLQTRVPRLSMDNDYSLPDYVKDYLNKFSETDREYFDAYAYDTIWSLAHLYHSQSTDNQSATDIFKKHIETVDFIGATGRVRYANGGRIGEVLVEQFVACRMLEDGTCTIPCYEERTDCGLTVVKVFLAKNSDYTDDPPVLYKLSPIRWHGAGPPRDRTNQTVEFQHVYLSVFISISICSGLGVVISCAFLTFNIQFRSHRYIRMSSPLLNNLILCGCMLAYASIILMGVNSSLFASRTYTRTIMNVVCPIRVWILCLSFTLAFGSMFSKTWRVHSIFTNINITKKGIHDSRLMGLVTTLVSIDLIFLILWQLSDPIHRELIYSPPIRSKSNPDIDIIPYREECTSKNMSLWFVMLIIYKGLLMFYGSFLSWKTRRVTIPALNDSRYIGLSVYIVFICCTLGSLVIFIPPEQVQFSYCVRAFFIGICTTATVCLVFVPKVGEVYRDPHSRRKQPRVTSRFHERNNRSAVVTIQHLNAALANNEDLKMVLAMQEETIARLVEELDNPQTAHDTGTDAETFELERLIVSADEDDDDQIEETSILHEDDDDDGDQHRTHPLRSHPLTQSAGVARALSLCLLNKVQLKQLHWPETVGVGRYSIPAHNERYRVSSPSSAAAKSRFRQAYLTSSDTDRENSKLIDITEDTDSAAYPIEQIYDGLRSLDEYRLEQMVETDLISSSNC